jgi:chemotaxis protein methyltransferase CheR
MMTDHNKLLIVRQFIEERYGLFFDESRFDELSKLLENIACFLKFRSTDAFLNVLLRNKPDKAFEEAVISSLTTGESYFFREPKAIEFFEKEFMNMLHDDPEREISVWSAACCCGQEPYSLAIVAAKHGKLKNLRIIGSDLNPQFINIARSGVFSPWSFRSAPQQFVASAFSRTAPGMYRINDEYINSVNFYQLNLMEPVYPDSTLGIADLDFIFCRNLFIYLRSCKISQLLEKLWHCLKPGGYLILGACESQIQDMRGFSHNQDYPAGVFKRENSLIQTSCIIQKKIAPEIKPDNSVRKIRSIQSPAAKIEAIKAESEAEPNFAELLEFFASGRFEQLLDKLNRFQNLCLDHHILYLKAKTQHKMGNIKEALATIDQAIKLSRARAEYHFFKSLLLIEDNRLEEGVKSLQLVLYLDEKHLPAFITLSNVLRKQGKLKEAKKFINLAYLLSSQLDENLEVELSDGMTVYQLKSILEDLMKRTA